MALFRIDTEYRCIDRRLMIQTDDIGGFFLELRIVTGNIAAQSMRLQPGFGQDAHYPAVVGAKFGGNLASRPMRRSISRFALRPVATLWPRVERFLCCESGHDAGRRGHRDVPQQSALSTI